MRLLVLLAIITAFAAPAFAAMITYEYEGGTLSISASEIEQKGAANLVFKDNAHLKDVNRIGNSTLEAFARTITVKFAPESRRDASVTDIIGSARFAGPVRITQVARKTVKDERTGEETTVVTTMEVTADNATYDGATMMADLTGNVKATYTDPSKLKGPATFVAHEATINLDPNAGPNDLRFRIRGEPSRLTGTMKNKGT